jgi:hypothetical protein
MRTSSGLRFLDERELVQGGAEKTSDQDCKVVRKAMQRKKNTYLNILASSPQMSVLKFKASMGMCT